MMKLAGYLRLGVVSLVLLLISPLNLFAQRQLFHSYGTAEGLSNLNVRVLFQDQTGYIWVGTDNGLFRYDGGKFRGFGHAEGLIDTEVVTIAQSPEGRLWIGTNSSVAVLEGEHFRAVPAGEVGAIHAIAFDSTGSMYVASDGGIVRGVSDGKGSYTFSSVVHGTVNALSASAGEIFFGKDGDLCKLRGDKIEPIGTSSGLPHDEWNSTVLDNQGNRWVRSRSRLFEMPRGQARFVDRSAGIADAMDPRLYTDRHGNVFVPTSLGISVLSGTHRALIDARHGLPADLSGPMLVDREDLLWMGTNGAGLIRRLGHGEWLAWTQQDGLVRNSIWAVQSDRVGNIWVGNNGGITILDPHGEVVRSWTTSNGLAGERVLTIARGPSGDFYAGTDPAGITHFSEKGVLLRTYRPGPESGYNTERITSMTVDHQQYLWAVGNGGCFRSRSPLDHGPLKFAPVVIPNVPDQIVYRDVVAAEDGTMWIASSYGLLHYDGRQWRNYTTKDGLKVNNLGVVSEAGGSIWIAYRDALGMTRLEPRGSEFIPIHVTAKDGLHSDGVYGIASDRKGRLWVSTDMGVDLFDQGRWKHFGSENGLIWDDTDSLALHVDSADNVWIGTSGGLSRYAQPEFPLPETSPPIVLTSISSGVSQQWEATDEPSLSFAQRSLTIQYAALTYESESATRFRYRLKGFENEWNETTERSVHFAALPAGHYVFEVTSAGSNGLWNPVPARFTFSIVPPWWTSWWFIALAVVSTLLIGSGFVRVRLRVLEAQKRELEKQVTDRTAQLVTSHRQLEEMAYCDVLTSLPNRRMFTEEFRRRLANPNGSVFSLLLIDLDHFKHVNDTFGHDAGDAVLCATAHRIKAELRDSDFVARLGGDEYAILLSTADDQDAIEAVCRRILISLALPIAYRGLDLQVGCSIGIARYPIDSDNQEGLYKSADVALYRAKQSSRNAFRWHQPSAHDTGATPLLQ